MTTEQPSPDQTETWEPDWSTLIGVMQDRYDHPYACIAAVIAEYRAQLGSAGFCLVRRDVHTALVNYCNGYRKKKNMDVLEAMYGLAAAKEQDE